MAVDLSGWIIKQCKVSSVNGLYSMPIITHGSYTGTTEEEYTVLIENNGNVGTAKFRWSKQDISWNAELQKWEPSAWNQTGLTTSSSSAIENGITVEFRTKVNPDATYDYLAIQDLTDFKFIEDSGEESEFITSALLDKIYNYTFYRNGTPLVDGKDYYFDLANNLLFFTTFTANEVLFASAPKNTLFGQTANPNIVINSFLELKENGIIKTLNVDYVADTSGLIDFSSVITNENLVDYIFAIEPSLFSSAFTVYKNSVPLEAFTDYDFQAKGGFINLKQTCFPGDIVTIDYESQDTNGNDITITSEKLIQNPAFAFNTKLGPFNINSSNNILQIKRESNPIDTLELTTGSNISMQDLVDDLNSILSGIAEIADNGLLRLQSLQTDQNESQLEILATSTCLTELGLSAGTTTGGVALGGEYSFDTQYRPIKTNSFVASEGDTEFQIEGDVTANYATGSLISVIQDLYTVQSATFDGTYTIITPDRALVRDYNNPDLFFTNTTPVFINDGHQIEDVSRGSSEIIFKNEDYTLLYGVNKVVKLNDDYYIVSGSEYKDGNTRVVLITKTVKSYAKVLTTVSYTDTRVYNVGDNTLYAQGIPLLTQSYELRRNTVVLTDGEDYVINASGVITLLKEGEELAQGDVFELDYTSRRFLIEGDNVTISYTYNSNIDRGDTISADFTIDNPDNFYFKVITVLTASEIVKEDLKNKIQQKTNPTSGGIQQFEGAATGNEENGNAPFEYQKGESEMKDLVAARYTGWYFTRVGYFEDDVQTIAGYKVGASNGRVTETDIQNGAVQGTSRLFPEGYDQPEPKLVPALDGLYQNDDGSTTGNNTNDSLKYWIDEEISIKVVEQAAISDLQSGSGIHIYSMNVEPFVGTGAISITVDAYTIPATSLPDGNASDVAAVINAEFDDLTVPPPFTVASASGGRLVLFGNFSITTTGNAVLGIPSGTFTTSSNNWWLHVLGVESNILSTVISRQNSQLTSLNNIRMETTEPAYTNAGTEIAVATAFLNNTIAEKAAVDTLISNGGGDLATRLAQITARLSVCNARKTSIDGRVGVAQSDMASEELYDKYYTWIMYRIHRGEGVLTQAKTTQQIKDSNDIYVQNSLAVLEDL